eukprot:TRINITY_DN145_c0_g2_i1.p1 TRINITY_DN145_c0_g2~~TRINITY_DN145_c0_g2_i1.p1  ORF type:complete len:707 (-),score=268.83 TRINITY_DN145_c0_g2_i1:192-2312(-)
MRSLALGLAAAPLAAYAGADSAAQSNRVTPVEKVIQLLDQLDKELSAEAKSEAAQYDKYACFCKEQADEKQYMIEKSKKKMDTLTAKIGELDGEIADLGEEIKSLTTTISATDVKVKEGVDAREKAYKSYSDSDADISGAIAAMQSAIKALKDSKAATSGAKLDLAQLRALGERVLLSFPAEASQKKLRAVQVLTRLGQSPASYEYHSNDIIQTLETLLDDFLQNKKDLDTAEFEDKAAFEKNDLNLRNSIAFAEKDKAEKEQVSEAKTEEKSAAEADLLQETKERSADQAFLGELTKDCEKKAGLWDQRSKTRAAELTAISEAVTALKEGAEKQYSANKKLVGLQRSVEKSPVSSARPSGAAVRSPSFLQLRGSRAPTSARPSSQQRAAAFLAEAARRLGSQTLAAAAARAGVSDDHFVKVRGLIKDLVSKLEADAEAEATQKSFCDTAMKTSVDNRDKAKASIESLSATKSKLDTEKATLTAEIADFSKAVAELQKALNEATQLRQSEAAENAKTIATAQEGKNAVDLALQVLTDFYASAASELQVAYVPPKSDREGKTVGDRAPEVFDSKYEGAQASSKGITGLLQVIQADFERTVSTVTAEEADAVKEFGEFETSTNTDIGGKQGSMALKESRVKEVEGELVETVDSLKDEQGLLDTALAELSELKEQCVDGEESYEERVARRNKEIESLKQALTILEEWQN